MPRVVAYVVAIVLIAIAPGSALADDAEDQAKAEFLEGVQAAREGRLQDAVAHYNSSLDFKPHPRTYFNLGVVSEELGNYPQALVAFRNFVRTADPEKDKQQIAEVNQRIVDLSEKARVVVSIDSNPSGANVYIDGASRAAGITPVKLRLAPGTHRLKFTASGKEDTPVDIEVTAGSGQQFSVTLAEIKSGLSVSANLASALVVVDSVQIGDVSQRDFRVPAGKRKIVVRADGYIDAEKTFDLPPGGTTSIEAELGRARTTTQLIILGSLATTFTVTTGVATVLGIQAQLDDNVGRAHVADGFGVTGAVLGAATVILYLVTNDSSSLRIK